jgi:hypothetical protein
LVCITPSAPGFLGGGNALELVRHDNERCRSLDDCCNAIFRRQHGGGRGPQVAPIKETPAPYKSAVAERYRRKGWSVADFEARIDARGVWQIELQGQGKKRNAA